MIHEVLVALYFSRWLGERAKAEGKTKANAGERVNIPCGEFIGGGGREERSVSCVCMCCIIWLCRAWIIDTLPRNRGPIPGNRGETDREFKLGGSISPLLAPRMPRSMRLVAASLPPDVSCMHLQKRTNSPNTTTNNHWITRLKRRVIYELNVCASESITRHEYFRVYPSPVFPSSRPINSSPTSSFLVQSLMKRRTKRNRGVFSRNNYPSSPNDIEWRGYGKRGGKKKGRKGTIFLPPFFARPRSFN